VKKEKKVKLTLSAKKRVKKIMKEEKVNLFTMPCVDQSEAMVLKELTESNSKDSSSSSSAAEQKPEAHIHIHNHYHHQMYNFFNQYT